MEAVAVEAVKASGVMNAAALEPVTAIDPAAVAAFDEAMAAAAPVPFIEQLGATWKAAQLRNQAHIRRITQLSALADREQFSVARLSALQYEIQTTNFELEVTTLVAKKSSEMVQTLVKNG